jgi:hypothetical protein
MQDDEYIEVQDPEKYKQFKFLENLDKLIQNDEADL